MSIRSFLKASAYSSIIYILGLNLILVGSGCKKFLDIKPSTNSSTNPHLVSEFEQMLNNASLASPNYFLADLMSDDIALPDELLSTYSSDYHVKAYQWWPVTWDPSESAPMYNNAYQMIFQCNVILDKLTMAPDGTPAQKSRISAQAKIHRAYYYFQLTNLYGKTYNEATATQDLAVPLVLKPDASLLPARATVKEVYTQILKDLQDAINTTGLSDFGVDVIHPGKAAALALQARVYLFMANYTQALATANACLQIKSTLLDYNNFELIDSINGDPSLGVLNKPVSLMDQTSNPENLLARICVDPVFISKFSNAPFISDELRALFGSTDLRFVYNFNPGQYGAVPNYFLQNNTELVFNTGIGVPEVLLIKAECLARQGDASNALAQLELIRKFRYRPADYVPLINNGDEEVLKQVLAERRKELFLHGGIRLFDLKRLNMDPRFSKDIVRVSDTDGHTITTLSPGSPAYLVPFAPQIITANPSIIQNPR